LPWAYWEGDVSIQGKIDGSPVHGVGYTEINPSPGLNLDAATASSGRQRSQADVHYHEDKVQYRTLIPRRSQTRRHADRFSIWLVNGHAYEEAAQVSSKPWPLTLSSAEVASPLYPYGAAHIPAAMRGLRHPRRSLVRHTNMSLVLRDVPDRSSSAARQRADRDCYVELES
jgi:hypothetical protein